MTLLGSGRVALRALAANPLRSVLTTLGVIIGVAAVVTTISIGAGARESTRAQVSALGTNLLTVFAGRVFSPAGVGQGGGTAQTLTLEDAEAIQEAFPDVEAVSAELNRSAQVVAGSNNDAIAISGVTPSMTVVRNWGVAEGSFFGDVEMHARARVAVLGAAARDTLFPEGGGIGQRIRVNQGTFAVIGVMERKGATGFVDRDDIIFIPVTTAQRRLFGSDSVRTIYVKVRDADRMAPLMVEIERLLRSRHRVPEDEESDFVIRNQADLVEAFQGVNRTISMLLAAIAAVSLVVGGIGIMNIMLVSVTERTREIGIRKAVGARRRDILLQFLVEAVALSITGGAIGILMAIGVSRAIAVFAGWPIIITGWALLLAFGFSAAVGIFFGLYPARRAAALNPIEALRHE